MTPSLPDYTIVRELGSGGSATVYLAVQNRLNRRVALKVLGRGLAADRDFAQRFLREARIVARLSHPHIVPVYDADEHEGVLFMAMEYVGGGSLAQYRHLKVARGLQCLRQVCLALEYAHSEGFVHRDIKPDNILLREDGSAMVADFGVARATESLTRMTLTGAIIGTPAYMSPEQVAGAVLDGRADLYSLGVVLYEMLCGHRPFSGDSVMSVGLQHMTAEVPALPAGCATFEPVVARLLAKKPEERYQSAPEVIQELDRLLQSPGLPREARLDELHSNSPARSVALTDALASGGAPKASGGRLRIAMPLAALAIVGILGVPGWWFFRSAAAPPAAVNATVIDTSASAAGLIGEWLQEAAPFGVELADAIRGPGGNYTVSLGTNLDFDISPDRDGVLTMIHLGADDAVSLLYPDPAGMAIDVRAGTPVSVGDAIGLVSSAPTGQEWFVFLIGDTALDPPVIDGVRQIGDWARRYPFGGRVSPGQDFVRWLLAAGAGDEFGGILIPVEVVR